jgi:3-methylcrotonyl-CoA carboxylase alpha subunit
MFTKILIANRGEIACRIIDTASRLGIKTVAVFSDADARALHVQRADEAVYIGESAVTQSYLVGERIIDAADRTGAQAIHPGYGFLSENPDFVDAVTNTGLTFIGPSASAIRAMGLKDSAKALMLDAGVPVVPGYHGQNQDPVFLQEQARDIGYPVMIKARAGGGGKGMRVVKDDADFRESLDGAVREGAASFGDPAVLIEKFIQSPRHIEVQVFGDSLGNVVHLFERDCSLQRRHQKVIEEAPAPGMPEEVRQAMTQAAIKAARAIDYTGAGTIEFIVDGSGGLRTDGFWFMEMNTRLQVEHPVTEAVTGTDLVEWQLRVAAGEALPLMQDDITLDGHAFEARLYAEDPDNDFLPVTGTIEHLTFGDARIDTGVRQGAQISPFYDPMIAKLTAHGATRTQALSRLRRALQTTHVAGLVTNTTFLHALSSHSGFVDEQLDTGLIERDLSVLLTAGVSSELASLLPMAVAALVLVRADVQHESAASKPLRLWGASSERVLIQHGDEVLELCVNKHLHSSTQVVLPEDVVEFESVLVDKNKIEVQLDGHTLKLPYAIYSSVEGWHVSVVQEGVTHRFHSPDPLNQTSVSATQGDDVRAPMTGAVTAVLVAEGDEVKAGQSVLVMEAMKMEHTLQAPRDGNVSAVLCSVGSQVSDGTLLVTLAL